MRGSKLVYPMNKFSLVYGKIRPLDYCKDFYDT